MNVKLWWSAVVGREEAHARMATGVAQESTRRLCLSEVTVLTLVCSRDYRERRFTNRSFTLNLILSLGSVIASSFALQTINILLMLTN